MNSYMKRNINSKGILSISQLISPDAENLEWASIKELHHLTHQGQIPLWFKHVRNLLVTPDSNALSA